MKLLLTSTGLANEKITSKFLELINKPVSKVKILFIPTAARTKEELYYANVSKKELLNLGIRKVNIQIIDLGKPLKLKDFDVIYVCGGNTFYLLKKVRDSGFDRIVKEAVKQGKLYFGVSAGSILVCPNIDIASPFDPNNVNLKDLTGLNLIEEVLSPHYTEKEKEIIGKYRKKYKIITLTDNQALVVIDNKQEII